MTASRSAPSGGSERSLARRKTPSTRDLEPRVMTAVLHGHRGSYRTAGEGPVILLIHGITCDSRQWNEIIPQLAGHYTVLAPEPVLPLLAHARVNRVGDAIGEALGRLGLELGHYLAEMTRGYASLSDAESRRAFLYTVRAVIDLAGQRVDATDWLPPRTDDPHADPLGPQGSTHRRRASGGRPSGYPLAAAWRSSTTPATSRTSRSTCASPDCSWASSRTPIQPSSISPTTTWTCCASACSNARDDLAEQPEAAAAEAIRPEPPGGGRSRGGVLASTFRSGASASVLLEALYGIAPSRVALFTPGLSRPFGSKASFTAS